MKSSISEIPTVDHQLSQPSEKGRSNVKPSSAPPLLVTIELTWLGEGAKDRVTKDAERAIRVSRVELLSWRR